MQSVMIRHNATHAVAIADKSHCRPVSFQTSLIADCIQYYMSAAVNAVQNNAVCHDLPQVSPRTYAEGAPSLLSTCSSEYMCKKSANYNLLLKLLLLLLLLLLFV